MHQSKMTLANLDGWNCFTAVPELRLLTVAARPGYPGCTSRRWSWLRVWMMDMENKNEWICVIVCASIDSALSLRMEALSSVNVREFEVDELDGVWAFVCRSRCHRLFFRILRHVGHVHRVGLCLCVCKVSSLVISPCHRCLCCWCLCRCRCRCWSSGCSSRCQSAESWQKSR